MYACIGIQAWVCGGTTLTGHWPVACLFNIFSVSVSTSDEIFNVKIVL